jgi:putative membrane protein insertion efficiency factor
MVSALECGRAAAEPCFGHAVPAAGSGSRPDLARPRPCDLRGPRSGPPPPGRPGVSALLQQWIHRSGACRVRDRATGGFCSRPQSHPPTPSSRRGRPCRRPRPGRRVSLRCGALGADPRLRRTVFGSVRARRTDPGVAPVTAPQSAEAAPRPTLLARLLMLPVRAWRLVSVHLPPRCRFHPSCSQYALDALTLHGGRRGTWLAMRRVARCHPWHPGGFDPVPEPNVRSTHVLPQT